MNDNTLVSIVMSLYKPDKELLKKSIEAISDQSYSKIETIIIDDGLSNEENLFLKKLIKDKKNFFIYKNSKNLGLTKSLNIGISKSKGDLIARNDADDISDKQRIEKQVNYFKNNKKIGVLGTWYSVVNTKKEKHLYKYLNDHNILFEMLFETNPFCHSSVMFKKDIFEEFNGYNQKFKVSQDLDLWFRISKKYSLNILQENLIERYLSKNSISMSYKRWMQLYYSLIIRFDNISRSQNLLYSIFRVYKTFFKGIILNISPPLTDRLQKFYREYFKKGH